MKRDDTHSTLKNFIVFEGIDGSGTTTQMRRISASLESGAIPTMVTSEPTSRPEGALIRRILKGELDAEPGTVAYLFAADRYQHVFGKEGIAETAQNGTIVLCDRYAPSSLAYQGITCGKELPRLLNDSFPAPGLTLYFKVNPETAMRRVSQRNQFEIYEKLHIQKLVSAAYEEVMAEVGEKGWKIAVIDAEKPIDEVTRQIISEIERHFGMKLGSDLAP
jgi:dTMP kinase